MNWSEFSAEIIIAFRRYDPAESAELLCFSNLLQILQIFSANGTMNAYYTLHPAALWHG